MSVGLNGMSDRVQTLHTIMNQFQTPIGKYTYPESKNQQKVCQGLNVALKEANFNNGLILMVVHER